MTDKKFAGELLTMLYPTRSGLTARSMPLDEENLAKLQEALQKAGPGCKLALKPTSDKYRSEKSAQLEQAGKRGSPAQYIIEVLNAKELAEESARLKAQDGSQERF